LWVAVCGSLRIDKISTPTIRLYIEKRLKGTLIRGRKIYAAASPRTVALDIIALRNVLKTALDAGLIREIPRFPKLKVPPPHRRSLVSDLDFQRLLDGCSRRNPTGEPVTQNALQLADLLNLLDACGARETEAYSISWKHIDFVEKRLWIGVDPHFDATVSHGSTGIGGTSKNRRSRSVEFNSKLERQLLDMRDRMNADSIWLFPSPKRGKVDRPLISLRESLNLVRDAVGLKDFGFHDCRHRFTSRCVMAGIDYMTIAKWLGHQDGGILVGKVYGHLSDEHRKKMAMRLGMF
jgi:integrase